MIIVDVEKLAQILKNIPLSVLELWIFQILKISFIKSVEFFGELKK
jgi:hypothetical protein